MHARAAVEAVGDVEVDLHERGDEEEAGAADAEGWQEAYAAAQRRGEVATRLALGATPGNIFWLVLRQGRTLAISGTAIGIAVAYFAGRIVSSRIYEVRASDPMILGGATLLVPFTRDAVPEVDVEGGRLTVVLPEELSE